MLRFLAMKIAALILAALSFTPSSGVRSFVHDYLTSRHGRIERGSRIAAATLANGTVLAYIFGSQWCGATGGCVLLVLKPNGSSYRVIGSKTPVKLPIYVLERARYGEPGLGLIYAGSGQTYRGGLWYPEGIVPFDGHSYGGVERLPDRFLKLGELQGRETIFSRKHNALTLGAPL